MIFLKLNLWNRFSHELRLKRSIISVYSGAFPSFLLSGLPVYLMLREKCLQVQFKCCTQAVKTSSIQNWMQSLNVEECSLEPFRMFLFEIKEIGHYVSFCWLPNWVNAMVPSIPYEDRRLSAHAIYRSLNLLNKILVFVLMSSSDSRVLPSVSQLCLQYGTLTAALSQAPWEAASKIASIQVCYCNDTTRKQVLPFFLCDVFHFS